MILYTIVLLVAWALMFWQICPVFYDVLWSGKSKSIGRGISVFVATVLSAVNTVPTVLIADQFSDWSSWGNVVQNVMLWLTNAVALTIVGLIRAQLQFTDDQETFDS